MHKVVLILAILLLVQLPALSADRDEKSLTKLMAVASGATDISSTRGGSKSGKPLGFYFNKSDMVFRSGYEKQPAKTMAEFAYDLAEFNHTKGGGYDNFYSYKQEQKQKEQKQIDDAKAKGEPEAVIMAIGTRQLDPTREFDNPDNPWLRAHVSYNQQKGFAEKWWQDTQAFKDAVMKDWWLNDAILDANNLWATVDTAYADPADARTYYDHQLRHLLKKK